MPSEQALDAKKPWILMASFAMIVAFFTLSCLLIRSITAPVGAAPLAVGPYQAGHDEVPPNAAEAALPVASPTPPEPSLAQQAPRARAAPQRAEEDPREPVAPQQAELAPTEPGAPYPKPDDPAAEQASASEQIVFKTRAALEVVDPRELLRRGASAPK